MNSLVDFASRRSGTVAVWVPIIFNQQEATNDLEFLVLGENNALNTTTDSSETSVAVVRKKNFGVNLAAAVASETDFGRQLELFR